MFNYIYYLTNIKIAVTTTLVLNTSSIIFSNYNSASFRFKDYNILPYLSLRLLVIIVLGYKHFRPYNIEKEVYA